MQNRETELAIGDSLQIGDCLMTVIDIDGDEVSFRIDQCLSGCAAADQQESTPSRPKK